VPQRLLPEGGAKARPVLVFVAAPDVIDEKVEATLLLRYAGEQGFDLGVCCMVAVDGDPLPTSLRDRVRSFSDTAGKTFGCAARIAAARDIDGRARFPEGEGDALADAATGPSDDRYSSVQR
jgi:hypothetical protein